MISKEEWREGGKGNSVVVCSGFPGKDWRDQDGWQFGHAQGSKREGALPLAALWQHPWPKGTRDDWGTHQR